MIQFATNNFITVKRIQKVRLIKHSNIASKQAQTICEDIISQKMHINIHSASNNTQPRQLNSRKASRQGSEIKMTLKEYLESVNLKRRISSRSKQRRKPTPNDPNFNHTKQMNYLQAPINNNPTVQFYKLNQQWKAIKQFSSWIGELKQLCRDFIKKDEEYVEVVRLIEKISQFVKSEVETIKRDHLLLQSFLVTEASYWGEEVGNGGEGNLSTNNPNYDRFSNYIKAVLSTNSQYSHESRSKFTNEKQKIEQNFQKNRNPHALHSPQQSNNKDIDSGQQSIPTNHKVCYKTSTEPKTHPSSYVKHAEERDSFHRTSLSSGKIDMQGKNCVGKEESSREYKIGSIKNPKNENSLREKQNQYIYSFNDKNALKTHNYHNLPQTNNHNNPHVNPFQHSTNKTQEENCSEQLGLLKIQSKNQDQVLRLSLMSRFDQHKQLSKNNSSQVVSKEIESMRKDKNEKVSNSRILNEYLRKIEQNKSNSNIIQQQKQPLFTNNQAQYSYQQSQQILNQSPQKPPLRQRRHKNQKLSQQSQNYDENQFQMIKLDEGSTNLYNQIQPLIGQNSQNGEQKGISSYKKSSIKVQSSSKLQNKVQASPSMVRQSPHVISIETPSTLRRRYSGNNNNEASSAKKHNGQVYINNIKDAQSHPKANESSRTPYDNGKRVQSRGNIMMRYQNFRKAN